MNKHYYKNLLRNLLIENDGGTPAVPPAIRPEERAALDPGINRKPEQQKFMDDINNRPELARALAYEKKLYDTSLTPIQKLAITATGVGAAIYGATKASKVPPVKTAIDKAKSSVTNALTNTGTMPYVKMIGKTAGPVLMAASSALDLVDTVPKIYKQQGALQAAGAIAGEGVKLAGSVVGGAIGAVGGAAIGTAGAAASVAAPPLAPVIAPVTAIGAAAMPLVGSVAGYVAADAALDASGLAVKPLPPGMSVLGIDTPGAPDSVKPPDPEVAEIAERLKKQRENKKPRGQ